MIAWIRKGLHMLINVNSGGHWVAVDEAKSLATGQIYIMDSLSGAQNTDLTLASRYASFNAIHAYTGGSTPSGGTVTPDPGELLPPAAISSDLPVYAVGDSATVKWTSVPYADYYAIQINKDDKFVLWDNVGTSTSYKVSDLEEGTYEFYVWTSRSRKTSSSVYCTFKVEKLAPPANISSDLSVYTAGDSATVEWTSVPYADYYAIQINKDDKFVLWDNVGTSTSYKVSDLEEGTYEFYVWTSRSRKTSSSVYCTFKVEKLAPPANISSDLSVYTAGDSATVEWTSVPYADYYAIQINKDDKFVLWDNVGTSTSYKVSDLEEGTYEFYVWTCHSGAKSSSRFCTFEVKGEVHQHSYTSVISEPTCTKRGYTTHTCACGDSYVDTYVDALGHSWDSGTVTKEPTATETGIRTFTCTRCGETKTETIPKLTHEHSYKAVVTAPTCTAKGYTTHTCACGESYVDTYVDALGHAWDNGKVTKEPTATETGVRTYTCTRCSATKTETIPATGSVDVTQMFTDVTKNWAYPGIQYCVTHGIMGGMGDGTFAPTGTTTRAQIVQILYNLEGTPAVSGTTPFTDLTANWYKPAILWAYQNNVVAGTSSTTFAPDQPVTREQIAVILTQYMFHVLKMNRTWTPADLSTFPDGAQVSSWAKEAMQDAVALGLINGTKAPDGLVYLDPQGSAARQQVATILMNFCQNVKK